MQSRIVARLTAPVVAVSGALIVVALGAAWYARDSQRSVSVMLDSHVASVRAAQELEISLREIHVQFDRYLITGERKHLESVPRLRQRAAEALGGADRVATSDQEQALMRRVRKGYDHFFAEYDRLEQTPPPQGVYAKVLELIDTVLAREILEPAREYLRVNEGMLARATEANRELSQRLTIGLVGLGVCGSVGGLLGGWVIAVSLRRSLLDTDRVLRDTAAQLGEAAHVPPGAPGRREPRHDPPAGNGGGVRGPQAAQADGAGRAAGGAARVGRADGRGDRPRGPQPAHRDQATRPGGDRHEAGRGVPPARLAGTGGRDRPARTDHQRVPGLRPPAPTDQETGRNARPPRRVPRGDRRTGRTASTSRSAWTRRRSCPRWTRIPGRSSRWSTT